jgi:hypothetical protein
VNDEIDERLERLRSATDGVRPRADFSARVLGAVSAKAKPAVDFWSQLPRAARWFVPVAALTALVSLGLAASDRTDVDDAVVANWDEADVE